MISNHVFSFIYTFIQAVFNDVDNPRERHLPDRDFVHFK